MLYAIIHNVRGRPGRRVDPESHVRRISPGRPNPLCRAESCCAGYKCEPAPTGGWKYVGRGRQDDRQKAFGLFFLHFIFRC